MTEGNPFFASEVFGAGGNRRAAPEADIWQVAGLDEVRVPELVRQVIEGRLDRLGDDARRLLEIAAVIGHEVDIDLWTEISGADERALVDVLERGVEARLVEELPGGTRLRSPMRWCARRSTPSLSRSGGAPGTARSARRCRGGRSRSRM